MGPLQATKRYVALLAVGAGIVTMSGLVPASAASAATRPAHAKLDHIMVYTTTGDTIATGLESTASDDPSYRRQAEDYLATVLASKAPKSSTADATHIPLPSDQELAVILSALESQDAATVGQSKAGIGKPASQPATAKRATATPAVAAASDPTAGWPIKGSKTDSSGLSWKMQEYNQATFCNVSGCTVYDRITSNISINTGPTTARITHQTLWSPKHGELNSPHFDLYAVCSGSGCGSIAPSHDIRTDNRNETFYLDHTTVWGRVVTIGVNLRSTNSSGGALGDPGKTHDWTCPTQASGNTACKTY